MGKINSGLCHIEKGLSAGGARANMGRRRQWRRDDQAFGKRCGQLGHAAELKYVEIFVGVKPILLHKIAQGEIRRRTETRDANGFPLQIRDAFDFRQSHHVERRHVGYAADEDKVGAAENCIYDRGTPGKSYLGVAGQNHSGNLKCGWNVDQLNVESVLWKQILLGSIPKWSIDPTDR